MGDLYLVCASSDILQDGSCAAPHWVQAPQLLPALSISDGLAIGTAIVLVWAIAWAYRQARRAL